MTTITLPLSTEATDEELMAAYVAGHPHAFDMIFKRYAPTLKGMLARGLPADIDPLDLLQQTFLHLHRARLDFKQGMKLRPWLFTIAMNLKREQFRRRGRRGPQSSLEVDPRGASSTALRNVLREEDAARVRKEVGRLPASQRRRWRTIVSASRSTRVRRSTARPLEGGEL